VRFASFFSGGFIIAIVVNPLERKLTKSTSVRCLARNINMLRHELTYHSLPDLTLSIYYLVSYSHLVSKFGEVRMG
jgi:hypothetical protein